MLQTVPVVDICMNVENSSVLITGGGSGIGLALAKRFAKAGSKVVICGRRQDVLDEARTQIPTLQPIQCDVADEQARIRLFEQVTREHPDLNVLINNAGVQVRQAALPSAQDWTRVRNELEINLAAPVHLSFCSLRGWRSNPRLISLMSPAGWRSRHSRPCRPTARPRQPCTPFR